MGRTGNLIHARSVIFGTSTFVRACSGFDGGREQQVEKVCGAGGNVIAKS